ncbi:putative membrane protein [Yersinia pestis PY-76]|nr:putative membrane protein [Yersinia pestis PY-76]
MARLELHGCIYGVFYDLSVLSVAGTLSITSLFSFPALAGLGMRPF